MAEEKAVRLGKIAKEFNVGLQHVVEYLAAKGIAVDSNPNAKINLDVYVILQEKYQPDKLAKQDAQELTREKNKRDSLIIEAKVSKGDLQKADFENDTDDSLKQSLNELKLSAAEKKPVRKKEQEKQPEPEAPPAPVVKAEVAPPEVIKATIEKNAGPKVLGMIDLDAGKKKAKAKKEEIVAAKPIEVEKPKKSTAKAKKNELVEKPIAQEPPPAVATPVAETPAVAAVPEPPAVTPEPPAKEAPVAPQHISVRIDKLSGPNIIGRIELPVDPPKRKPVASSSDFEGEKRKRKRKDKKGGPANTTQSPAMQQATDLRIRVSNTVAITVDREVAVHPIEVAQAGLIADLTEVQQANLHPTYQRQSLPKKKYKIK